MYLKIYLPTKSDQIIDYLVKRVSKALGGCTIIPNCVGFWINPENQVLKDEITIIESYSAYSDKITDFLPELRLILWKLKSSLKQDAIAYCLDNNIYFL